MITAGFDDRQIRAVLDRLAASARSLRPAMQSIGELLAELLLFQAPGAKLVVRVNYWLKKSGGGQVNRVETGRELGDAALHSLKGKIGRTYRLLEGGL